ncbi:MAG TPA: phosphate ABC transporter permease subunit PstC [Polyangiaceae bacterium]|nr:phosphate ABC transporter permease subunit PstC [Polyangiaceae bacterium]
MNAGAGARSSAALFGGKRTGDFLFSRLTGAFALVVVLAISTMALEMARSAAPTLSAFGLSFAAGAVWDPVHRVFGALPFVWGTLVSSLIALAIAVPVSFGVAVYLSELATSFQRELLGFLIEMLAAVPSVVYGLWGAFALAPWLRTTLEPWLAHHFGFLPVFQGPHQGFGMLAGGIVLSIMVLPTISAVSREVLRAVPSSLREGALALGATRTEMVRIAVLPYARSGLIGAVLLGLGRALGETMAITMVIGNRAEISASLFAPSYTMASVIANEFTEATDALHLSALAEMGLLLFAVTVGLNVVARLLVARVGKHVEGGRL